MEMIHNINIAKVIGKGYKQFWNFKGRYRAVKGGRGSKKSTTTAFWFIYNMMKYYHQYGLKPNTLVVRRFFNTHRDSTYSLFKWCIKKLEISHLWDFQLSPLRIIYKPSGQSIIFKGLDKPESLNSITVEEGILCWAWVEEAFQVGNEEDFNKLDLSIRGDIDPRLFKQITFTFNPWSERTWLKKRFFDNVNSDGINEDGSILAITTTYQCNEFLGADDRLLFAKMKRDNPRRYSIEGEGNWGIATGLIFTNWIEEDFDALMIKRQTNNYGNIIHKQLNGLDFGYTNDPTAFIATLENSKEKILYLYDEVYKTRLSNSQIFNELKYRGFENAKILADGADPRTIAELKKLGLRRIKAAKKGQGSVKAGIQKLQDYKLIVSPRCINTIVELNNYTWEKDGETGSLMNEPIGEYNHIMDALRYATSEVTGSTFSW